MRVSNIIPKKDICKDFGLYNISLNLVKLTRYKENVIYLDIDILNLKSIKDIFNLKEIFLNKIIEDIEVKFIFNKKFESVNYNLEELIEFYINLLSIENMKFLSLLSKSKIVINDSNLNFIIEDENIKKRIQDYNLIDELKKALLKYENKEFVINIYIESEYNKIEDIKEINIYSNIPKNNISNSIESIEIKNENININNKNIQLSFDDISLDDNKVEKVKNNKNDKKFQGIKIENLKLLTSEYQDQIIYFEGDCYDVNIRETKTGKYMVRIYITDYNESVICTKFYNNFEEIDFKISNRYKISGRYKFDTYMNAYNINLLNYEKIESLPKREDNAVKKRVELNLHTNMSELCSNLKPDSLMNFLKHLGHTAVAITDFGVLHALPFIDKYKGNIKSIMGIEAYVVDDEVELISNPKDIHILSEEYTVFDIETTGLDSLNDKITEIGAVKIKNNQVIGEFSEFINPGREIPEDIIKLTNITNEMVADKEMVDKVLPRFLEFAKGTTLVAHNAKFDVGFIIQEAKNIGIKLQKVSYIDTLTLAKYLLPDQKRFGLSYLTKLFEIELENHHRAIYDAQATYQVFIKLLTKCYNLGVNELKELNEKIVPNIKNSNTMNINILAKNKEGIKWLNELVSISHLEYYNKKPRIPKSLLRKNRENLLLSASPSYTLENMGELINLYARGFEKDDIYKAASFYDYIQIAPEKTYTSAVENGEFKDFEYVREMNKYMYNMGKELNIPVVAVGNTYYLEEKDAIIKMILEKESNKHFKTYFIDNKNYFRTTEEMLNEFSYLGDDISYEVVVENTNNISDMIESFNCIPNGFYPPKIEGAEDQVREMTYSKAYEIYGNPLPEIIEKKIKRELEAIINNGFSVLYLTAQKLVKKSLENGYIVGSRGSVGSSVVAFFMGITEVNGMYPHYICKKCKHFEIMEYEGSGVDLEDKNCPNCGDKMKKDGHAIPFEVFMGYDGDKVPDIDLNFSSDYQANIHKYTEELFGRENVFRAGTISTLAKNMAYTYTKKFVEEMREKKNLKQFDFSENEISRIANLCEGARKTTGQHPGGMIVVPSDMSIYDFCPIQKPANDMDKEPITHFDYHVMDQQLVKLDILGHDDPTTVKQLCESTGINVENIPLRDEKVIGLFSGPENLGVRKEDLKVLDSPDEVITGTNGIPEFGTAFVKRMLNKTKPKSFAELVKISGLSHGTDVWTNNAEVYVDQKIATLSEVITVRDDIMNYLNDSGIENSKSFEIMEFVRKGRPSKDKEKWNKYREIMKKHNVKDWYIDSCEKIKYMFPKGHAVAYVTMAVRIAYFKVYYPLNFYMAYLNRKVSDFNYLEMFTNVEKLKEDLKYLMENKNDKSKTILDKIPILEILIEMYYRGIELLPIDLYKSDSKYFIIEDGKLRAPFITMPSLGEAIAENIIRERNIKEFLSLDDLKKRTKISEKVLEILNNKGCLGDMSKYNQQSLF